MNAEYIEKQIKELGEKIADRKKKGQIKIVEIQKLQNSLNETATLILKYQSQVEVLKEVLEN